MTVRINIAQIPEIFFLSFLYKNEECPLGEVSLCLLDVMFETSDSLYYCVSKKRDYILSLPAACRAFPVSTSPIRELMGTYPRSDKIIT